MSTVAASLLQPGDKILCPQSGLAETVRRVVKSRAFIAVRTTRHDHIIRPGQPGLFELADSE